MAESVKVELPWESVLVIEPTEVPGERIGVHQLTALVREHIVAHVSLVREAKKRDGSHSFCL